MRPPPRARWPWRTWLARHRARWGQSPRRRRMPTRTATARSRPTNWSAGSWWRAPPFEWPSPRTCRRPWSGSSAWPVWTRGHGPCASCRADPRFRSPCADTPIRQARATGSSTTSPPPPRAGQARWTRLTRAATTPAYRPARRCRGRPSSSTGRAARLPTTRASAASSRSTSETLRPPRAASTTTGSPPERTRTRSRTPRARTSSPAIPARHFPPSASPERRHPGRGHQRQQHGLRGWPVR